MTHRASVIKEFISAHYQRAPRLGSTWKGEPVGQWWRDAIDHPDGELAAELAAAGIVVADTLSTDEWLALADEWAKKNPHTSYPSERHITADGYRLGEWIARQRDLYRTGELTDPPLERLRQGGFLVPVPAASDEHMFDDLDELIEKYGAENLKKAAVSADGHRMAGWLKSALVRAREGRLTTEQTLTLTRLGVPLNPVRGSEYSFEHWLGVVREYVDDHSPVSIQGNTVGAHGEKIGQWVRYQKGLARKGRLADDRRAALDELGIIMPKPFARASIGRSV